MVLRIPSAFRGGTEVTLQRGLRGVSVTSLCAPFANPLGSYTRERASFFKSLTPITNIEDFDRMIHVRGRSGGTLVPVGANPVDLARGLCAVVQPRRYTSCGVCYFVKINY